MKNKIFLEIIKIICRQRKTCHACGRSPEGRKSSFSLPLQGEAGGKGVRSLALPPAEPVNEISSDIFKQTPPVIVVYFF